MKNAKLIVAAGCFFFTATMLIYAQPIQEIEFRNQRITDILLVLAEVSGRSIIPDETVKGTASYYFAETDFDTAFRSFLESHKLYCRKEGDIYHVSRVHAEYDPSLELITMDAEDVELLLLIKAASRSMGKTVLHDTLPAQPLTVHANKVSPEMLLEILIKRLKTYSLEVNDEYYYVKRIEPKTEMPGAGAARERVEIIREGDMYSLCVEKEQFSKIVQSLFREAELEYSMLMRRDVSIGNLEFENKRFDQLLRLVLEQANADYKRVGEIYYIFEISQNDVLKKLKSTVHIPLTYLAAQDLIKLFPPELATTRMYTIDPEANSIILSGSLEEIGPIQNFIEQVDEPAKEHRYYRFDLNYVRFKDLKSILPVSFKHDTPVRIPQTNSFVMLLSPEKKQILEDYLSIIDRGGEVEIVRLRYVKSEHLLKNLPPSVSKEDIIETGDPSVVFVRGSEEKLETFFRELEVVDQPIPQIRYDILVILYMEDETFQWNQNLNENIVTIQHPPGQESSAVLATLGRVFTLSFDVVTNFGVQFAMELNAGLLNDKAKVLADTTLNGLSGEKVSFQNTNTYRYRSFEINPNTGELWPTGVVNEIVSGLIINVNGWVSGDDMITMEVEAEVSRLGSDVDIGTLKEPPTFEKIVKTHVRSRSGELLAIGGLITEDKTSTMQKTPLLGDIPVLGAFFRSEKDEMNRSVFVIYILPHAEYLYKGTESVARRMEKLFRKFFYF
jgi:general secretion pathway protein D